MTTLYQIGGKSSQEEAVIVEQGAPAEGFAATKMDISHQTFPIPGGTLQLNQFDNLRDFNAPDFVAGITIIPNTIPNTDNVFRLNLKSQEGPANVVIQILRDGIALVKTISTKIPDDRGTEFTLFEPLSIAMITIIASSQFKMQIYKGATEYSAGGTVITT